jgi:hypothetical protein
MLYLANLPGHSGFDAREFVLERLAGAVSA